MNLRERLARLSPAQRARLAARMGGTTEMAEPAEVAPLTPNQTALWLRDGVLPGPAANLYVAYRVSGPLDVAALTRGLTRLMARHAMLRTVFGERDGRPAQWCVADAALPFALVERVGTSAEAFAVEEASQGFDLARAAWRVRLARLGPAAHVLTLCMHEIAGDGRSFVVLLAELAALYAAERAGNSAEGATARARSFASFAARQQGLDLPRLCAEVRTRFAGWEPRVPATDEPRSLLPGSAGGRVHGRLAPAVAQALFALGRSVGATPFMTTFAVLALVLHRRMATSVVAVPVAVDGRGADEVDTVGFYLNLVPVISRLGEDDARGFLAATRDACLAALRAAELPLAELYPTLMPAATSPRSAFPVIFAHQNMGSLALALPGLATERLAIDNGTCSFEMAWFAAEEHGGVSLELRHDRALYTEETAAGWLADYVRIAGAMVADPGRRLASLPVHASGSAAVVPPAPLPARRLDLRVRGVLAYLCALAGPLVPDLPREQLGELWAAWLAGEEGLARLLRVPVRLLGPLFAEEQALTAWDLEMARHIGRILAAHLGVEAAALPAVVPIGEADRLAWLRPFAVWAGQVAPTADLHELAASLASMRRAEL